MKTQSSTLHRAAVISGREVWYGNGTAVTMLAGLATDLPRILSGALDRFTDHSTIILDGVSPAALTVHSETVRAAGWNHTKIEAWTVFHREDGRTVALGLRDVMRPVHLGVLFGRDTDPGVLAMLLDRFHRTTGNAWRATCATTALASIRLTWGNPQYQPRWNIPRETLKTGIGPLVWKRRLTERKAGWGYVHTFDANAAYLGSAINADLAWSTLHHTGPQMFDPTLPGYWLIELDTPTLAMLRETDRPPVLGAVRDGRAWVTTPYARLLGDLGDRLDIADSWTGRAEVRRNGGRLHPASSRILRKWGEGMRDSLAQARVDRSPVLAAVKRSYTDCLGGMQREGMRIYRPDWAHTVIDLWRATLYRRILAVRETEGIWPVRVSTDSISYADSGPDPTNLARAIGCGPRLGQFRHEDTVTADHWTAKHWTGRRGSR